MICVAQSAHRLILILIECKRGERTRATSPTLDVILTSFLLGRFPACLPCQSSMYPIRPNFAHHEPSLPKDALRAIIHLRPLIRKIPKNVSQLVSSTATAVQAINSYAAIPPAQASHSIAFRISSDTIPVCMIGGNNFGVPSMIVSGIPILYCSAHLCNCPCCKRLVANATIVAGSRSKNGNGKPFPRKDKMSDHLEAVHFDRINS
jgi:hypothetical protein